MSDLLAIRWNGRPVSGQQIEIDAADRGLILGDGVFETLPVLNGVPVWLDRHLDRLLVGALTLGLGIDRQTVAAEVAAIAMGQRHGILRITLTRARGTRGLVGGGDSEPGVLLSLAPWQPELVGGTMTAVVTTVRRNEGSPASRIKSLSYLDNILAAREAAAQGADDGLMRSSRGRLAGFSIGNVVLCIDDQLVTPPVEDGALPGIARSKLIEKGLVVERSLALEDWHAASGSGLTNSLRLMRQVKPHRAVAELLDVLCRDVAGEAGIDPRMAT